MSKVDAWALAVSMVSALLVALGVVAVVSPLGAETPRQSGSIGGYYLALGDSVPVWDGPQSYPDLIVVHHPREHLQLVNLAVSGETTTSMISGSQFSEAIAFLDAHRGHIALITIDIGGNDVVTCIGATDVQSCVAGALVTMQSNLTSMLAGLRSAAGPGVPIVGMNYFNPLLGDWLAPPGPAQELLTASESGLQLLNDDLEQIYTEAGSTVADVFDAFHTSDLSRMVHSRWGLVPRAVKKACTLLDITCSKGQPEGFGDDPVAAGAVVIAHAFDKVIRLHQG